MTDEIIQNFYFEAFYRSMAVLGEEAVLSLAEKSVLICGVGGVGSYAAMALARSGIGRIGLVDADIVAASNINRQLIANIKTVGMGKTAVMAKLIREINPHCVLREYPVFLDKENIPEIAAEYDYVIDCIDTVTSKLDLIEFCFANKIPIASSMGTGKKLRPELLELADIYDTSVCPLAKVMRKELKKRGVLSLAVCYSKEEPSPCALIAAVSEPETAMKAKRAVVGSLPFVPPVAGMILAAKCVRDLCGLSQTL